MTKRKNPPKLMRSDLTGRIYIVTRYKVTDEERGLFTALEKYDVTEDFEGLRDAPEIGRERAITERGFRIFGEFHADVRRETAIRVQESSAALEGPCVWVFVSGQDGLTLDLVGALKMKRALEIFVYEATHDMLTEPMANISHEPVAE